MTSKKGSDYESKRDFSRTPDPKGGKDIDISSREKILFPSSGITKGDVIDYYEKIADYMLPHLADRPLMMQRFPDGIAKKGFYQKERSDYFPDWIDTVTVKKEGGVVHTVMCNNKATLIYLANQSCITFHTWLCRHDRIREPDKMIFDLDPPDAGGFDLVLKGAKALHDLLSNELGLPAFVMTTGSKGLHIVCPLRRGNDFDEVRDFAHEICDYLADENPDTFTTETRKNKRKGRLFLDYLRNAYAQTSVCPYSLRVIEKAPVATPLSWDELQKPDLSPQSYNLGNIFRRLSQTKNPWGEYGKELGALGNAKGKFDKIN